MLKQIVINIAVTTAVSVLTCLVWTRYFHRCDDSPDVGGELRRMAAGWRYVAAEHRREMEARPGEPAAYAEHQAYWLAYGGCARRIEALLRGAGAGVAAEPGGEERSLPGPVRRVEGGG